MKKLINIFSVLLVLTTQLLFGNSNINNTIFPNISDILKVNELNNLAEINLNNSLELTKHYLDESLALSQKINYYEGEAKSYTCLGDYNYYSANIDETVTNYKDAIEIYKNINSQNDVVNTLNRFADNFYKHIGNYEAGFKCLIEALKISEEIGYKKGIGLTYLNIGRMLLQMRLPDERLSFYRPKDYFNQSLKIFEDIGDTSNYIFSVIALGMLYHNRNIDTAYLFYNKCQEISLKSNKQNFLAMSLRLKGIYFSDTKQIDSALFYLNQSYKIAYRISDINLASAVLVHLGVCYRMLQDYSNEFKFEKESLKLREKLGHKYLIASSLINIGECCFNHKSINDAQSYFYKGLLYALQSNNLNYTKNAYFQLYKLFSYTNDYKNSIFYFDKYNSIKDSITNNERLSQFDYLYYNTELEKKNKEKGDIEIDTRTIIIYGLAALIAVILIIIGAIYNLYHIKKNDNQKLTEKNDQLNIAIKELQTSNSEKELLNKELEERVFERTTELTKENEERKKIEENLKTSETILKKSLYEKEVLLKEMHHRVHQNLQIIVSLMNLQSKKIEDPNVLSSIKGNQERIKSLGLIHEKLYQSESYTLIDFGSYIYSIIDSLRLSFSENPELIELDIKCKNMFIELDKAIPLALIINEIVSNSLKYAFIQNQNGKISLSFNILDEYSYKITIADNGIGFIKDKNSKQVKSFGLELISLLVEQLHGNYEINNTYGTEFIIIFPIKYKKYHEKNINS